MSDDLHKVRGVTRQHSPDSEISCGDENEEVEHTTADNTTVPSPAMDAQLPPNPCIRPVDSFHELPKLLPQVSCRAEPSPVPQLPHTQPPAPDDDLRIERLPPRSFPLSPPGAPLASSHDPNPCIDKEASNRKAAPLCSQPAYEPKPTLVQVARKVSKEKGVRVGIKRWWREMSGQDGRTYAPEQCGRCAEEVRERSVEGQGETLSGRKRARLGRLIRRFW